MSFGGFGGFGSYGGYGGFGYPLFSVAAQQQMDIPDVPERQLNPPTREDARHRRTTAYTTMDFKELPSGALVLTVDMPGVSPADVRVQVENGSVLAISGTFSRRFQLPESADLDSIRAEYRDGVLTVTVEKLPPPKPRVGEVKMGNGGEWR